MSIPATWHTLRRVLDVDVGDGGREVRASFMGGEKASQYVTVEPASTCKETKLDRGGHGPKVT